MSKFKINFKNCVDDTEGYEVANDDKCFYCDDLETAEWLAGTLNDV